MNSQVHDALAVVSLVRVPRIICVGIIDFAVNARVLRGIKNYDAAKTDLLVLPEELDKRTRNDIKSVLLGGSRIPRSKSYAIRTHGCGRLSFGPQVGTMKQVVFVHFGEALPLAFLNEYFRIGRSVGEEYTYRVCGLIITDSQPPPS